MTDHNEAMRLADRISRETDWYEFDQVTWCNEAAALIRKQAERIAELERDYGQACRLVANLHAAATGYMQGPKRGVVEDVADVATERDTLRAEVERLRKLCVEQAQSLIERPVMDIDTARKATP